MTSKIEVGRDVLQRWAHEIGFESAIGLELRALLAANPNSWPCWNCKKPVTMANRADADGNCPHCKAELDIEQWPFPDQPAPVVERPPSELDEQQATIDRLTSENKRLRSGVESDLAEIDRIQGEHDKQFRKAREFSLERDQLATELERLKGGQGEPVAWEYKRKNQNSFGEPDTHIAFASKALNECRVGLTSGEYTILIPRDDYFDWKPLFYTSQPAPAPAVLSSPNNPGAIDE
jgi:hypothetical protein